MHPFVCKNAHGLHLPVACCCEPTLGSSGEPGANPCGGGGDHEAVEHAGSETQMGEVARQGKAKGGSASIAQDGDCGEPKEQGAPASTLSLEGALSPSCVATASSEIAFHTSSALPCSAVRQTGTSGRTVSFVSQACATNSLTTETCGWPGDGEACALRGVEAAGEGFRAPLVDVHVSPRASGWKHSTRFGGQDLATRFL